MPEFIVDLTITTRAAIEYEGINPAGGEAIQIDGLPNGDALQIPPKLLLDAMEQGAPILGSTVGSNPAITYGWSVRYVPDIWTGRA